MAKNTSYHAIIPLYLIIDIVLAGIIVTYYDGTGRPFCNEAVNNIKEVDLPSLNLKESGNL